MGETAKIMNTEIAVSRSQSERAQSRAFRPKSDMGIDYDLATTPKMDILKDIVNGLRDGEEMTLNRDNVYANDRFLILNGNESQKVTFRRRGDGVWRVHFDGDEPMLLEDTPASFWRTIRKNMK